MEFNSKVFTFCFGAAETMGVVSVVLTLFWCTYYRGGFGWTSQPKLEFNWHPLLMNVGFLFVISNGVLVFRTYRSQRKFKLKLAHAIINLISIAFISVGLKAAFDSHNYNDPPTPNLYTLHSWLGIFVICMYVLQWICGFVVFLYPGLSPPLRKTFLPIHVNVGIVIFTWLIIVNVLGFGEKALFSVVDYSKLPGEGVLVNLIGAVIAVFGCVVLYLVINPDFKRQPLPEDTVLLNQTEKKTRKSKSASETTEVEKTDEQNTSQMNVNDNKVESEQFNLSENVESSENAK